MDTTTRIEMFTRAEDHEIDKAIAKLREERRYSSKPSFLHDMILIGCRSINGETGKPSQKA